jgi:uncharacterized membrane protein
VFAFLAGTSAFLIGERKGTSELSSFLFKRGIWLILLEVTVCNFGWSFNIHFPLIPLIVIWSLGISMIVLAAFVHLPYVAILTTGIIMLLGHNLLDTVHFPEQGTFTIFWSILHEQSAYPLGSHTLFVGYPLIPWVGVMMLGYCLGKIYVPSFDTVRRKRILLILGSSAVTLFVVLRLINVYGDPSIWITQPFFVFSLLSFINVTKYPPSLDYLLVTLGPACIFLALTENWKSKITAVIASVGRVPMFYYVVHIYLIHIFAIAAAMATGYAFSDMIFSTWITDSPKLRGYGFNLFVVYIVWAIVLAVMIPLSIQYDRYKQRHRDKWWLSYL